MPDMEFSEFDRQLRSMLADAEVKPSRRVWKGVSARLAPVAPVASPWSWMRWAGLSLAAAAAVAAGIFFLGTRTSIPTKINNQPQATLLAQTGDAAGAPTDVAAPAAAPVLLEEGSTAPEAVSRTAVRPSRALPPDVRPAEAARESGEQPAPEATASLPADQPQGAPVSESGRKARQPRAAESDPAPFGAAEAERRGFRPRLALYAQGSVGSNDARPSPAPASRMAPGVPQMDEFIDLGSSSTYGVPFTLGLGVRLYVAPRCRWAPDLTIPC